jgi:hypothetical protein
MWSSTRSSPATASLDSASRYHWSILELLSTASSIPRSPHPTGQPIHTSPTLSAPPWRFHDAVRFVPFGAGARYDRWVVTLDAARAMALELPDVVEMPHHGFPSFRVRGRIFATIPDATHLNVMIAEAGIRALAAARPEDCAERWWGKRLAALTIHLALAEEDLVREMLLEAWQHKGGGSGSQV